MRDVDGYMARNCLCVVHDIRGGRILSNKVLFRTRCSQELRKSMSQIIARDYCSESVGSILYHSMFRRVVYAGASRERGSDEFVCTTYYFLL